MAEYVYEGPGPAERDGELVRPGDKREFDAPPDWGPWRCLQPDPLPDPPKPVTPAAPAPAVITPAAPAARPEGM